MSFRKRVLIMILSLVMLFSVVACRDRSETINDGYVVEEEETAEEFTGEEQDMEEEEVSISEEYIVRQQEINLADYGYFVDEEQPLEEEQFEELRRAADNYLQNNYQQVMTPREVYEKAVLYPDPDYYIVDIRGLDDFAEASIIGSVNMSYDSIWEQHQIEKLPKDKKIIVVCYTGHGASQVAAFWGLLGFDTVAMENGIAGWSGPLDCNPEDYELATEPTEASESFDLPEINREVENLEELILLQGEQIFADNKRTFMRHDQVKRFVIDRGSPRHFPVDLRESELYKKGHGEGAINIPFKELTKPENLAKLPTDRQIVLICADGYQSSQAARILNLLGYDALASQFGMSKWTADEEVIGDQPVICRDVVAYPTVLTRIEAPETEAG